MKMVILGLLMERDMHPYEIVLVMKARSYNQIVKLQPGSLYYAVDKLAADHYIEATETIKSTDRPDKTIYRITKKGITLFEQLVLQQIKKFDPIHQPLFMALALSLHIDKGKIKQVLEERIRENEHQVNAYYSVYEEHVNKVPRSALQLMYGRYELSLAELNIIRRLYADALSERLSEVGSPLFEVNS